MMFHSYLIFSQIMSVVVNFSLALIWAYIYMFSIILNVETGQEPNHQRPELLSFSRFWYDINSIRNYVFSFICSTELEDNPLSIGNYILVLIFLLIRIKLYAQSFNSSVGNKFLTQWSLSWIVYLSRASISISKSDFLCKRTCSNYWIPWQNWNMENLSHSSTFCGETFLIFFFNCANFGKLFTMFLRFRTKLLPCQFIVILVFTESLFCAIKLVTWSV